VQAEVADFVRSQGPWYELLKTHLPKYASWYVNAPKQGSLEAYVNTVQNPSITYFLRVFGKLYTAVNNLKCQLLSSKNERVLSNKILQAEPSSEGVLKSL